MIADGAAVTAARTEAGLDLLVVAARMRRHGLPGTTAHWVSMVERDRWGEIPPAWLYGLADALGVPYPLICAGPHLVVLR